jgi:cell division protein FtsL
MLYLLTEKQKRRVLLEYRLRLVTVIAAMLTFVGIIGCVSIVPSYSFLKVNQNILKVEQQNVMGGKSENVDELSQKIADITNKAAILNPIDDSVYSSNIFLHLEKIAGDNTTIREFRFTHFDENVSAQISGVSKNRESLTKFIDALRKDPAFSGVSFPYSSLAKQDNLEYALNLVVNLKYLKAINDEYAIKQ